MPEASARLCPPAVGLCGVIVRGASTAARARTAETGQAARANLDPARLRVPRTSAANRANAPTAKAFSVPIVVLRTVSSQTAVPARARARTFRVVHAKDTEQPSRAFRRESRRVQTRAMERACGRAQEAKPKERREANGAYGRSSTRRAKARAPVVNGVRPMSVCQMRTSQ